jgi:hypothetical protein
MATVGLESWFMAFSMQAFMSFDSKERLLRLIQAPSAIPVAPSMTGRDHEASLFSGFTSDSPVVLSC